MRHVTRYSAERHVLWTSIQTTSSTPAYPQLRIRIVQSAGALSGRVRDEEYDVDVDVSSGSVDETGNVQMTLALSNQGSLRQVLIFKGRVLPHAHGQQITGTYIGFNPCERGTFVMRHD